MDNENSTTLKGSSGFVPSRNDTVFEELESKERKIDVDNYVRDPNSGGGNSTENSIVNYGSGSISMDIGTIVPVKPQSPEINETFQAVQKWEGEIVDVGEKTFRARIRALVGEVTEKEVEIYKEEVTPTDHKLIEPGAVFYWSIGYRNRPSGIEKSSVIRLRRLPTWTRQEIDISKRDGAVKELRKLLDG